MRNSTTQYGMIATLLHWLMAAGIFGLFGLGVWMRNLGYYDTWYHKAPDLHQSIGMVMLALLLFRFLWVWINVKPRALGKAWERTGGLIAHRLFYLLMPVIMLSGYLIPTAKGEGFDILGWLHVPALLTLTPRQTDIDGAVHQYAAWAIVILAILHSAAALKHHLINKDATLLRMLGIPKY